MSELVDHGAAILAWLASTDRYLILGGDSAKVAPSIPDASIDAIVADPPAGIAFMGKAWDDDKGGESEWIAWLAGILAEGYRVLKPGGHCLLWALPRTSDWTMQALRRAGFEVRDVMTHLFGSGFPKSLDVSKAIDAAAGATREIVGVKSDTRYLSPRTNSPNHMDRANGVDGGHGADSKAAQITAPATPEARKWSGFGTALKPAAEFWILARKPLDGTVAANVLAHGTGSLNIDAARVGTSDNLNGGAYAKDSAAVGVRRWEGGALGASGREYEQPAGRFPANLVLSHTAWEETHCRPCGAVLSFVARFCPECGSGAVTHRRAGCCAVGERVELIPTFDATSTDRFIDRGEVTISRDGGFRETTVTAWECLATCQACGLSTLAPSGGAPPRCKCGRAMAWACAVARLDEQSGERKPGWFAGSEQRGIGYNGATGVNVGEPASCIGDSGGASRFFNTFAPPDDAEPFFWCAKPSAAETEAGCEALPLKSASEVTDREEGSAGSKHARAGATHGGRRNHHPTRKSIALMRHFCRLVCPPGGIVLDLFAGSGTTIGAWGLEGGRAIGIEMDPEFAAIARARAAFWGRLAGTKAATVAKPRPTREKADTGQGTLF